MWVTYIAHHQDPKQMTKSKEQFLPLKKDKKQTAGISEKAKQQSNQVKL